MGLLEDHQQRSLLGKSESLRSKRLKGSLPMLWPGTFRLRDSVHRSVAIATRRTAPYAEAA